MKPRAFVDTPRHRWIRRTWFGVFLFALTAASPEHQNVEVSGYGSVGRYSLVPFTCSGDPIPERRQAVNATASVKVPLSKTKPHALVVSLSVQPDRELFNGDLTAGRVAECEALIDAAWEAEDEAAANDESTASIGEEPEPEPGSLAYEAEMCERSLNRVYSTAWSKRAIVRPTIRYSYLWQKTGGRFVDLQIGISSILPQLNLERGIATVNPLFIFAPSFLINSNAGRYFYVNLSVLAESQYPILPIARFGFGPRFGNVRMLVSGAFAGAHTLSMEIGSTNPLYGMFDLELFDRKGWTFRSWVAMGAVDYFKRSWFSGGSISYAFDPWPATQNQFTPAITASDDYEPR